MKNSIFFLLSFLMSLGLQAQYLQSRLLEVSQENVTKFEAAVAEKTKMYNSNIVLSIWPS